MTFWEKQSYDSKSIGSQEKSGEREEWGSTADFQSNETILYDITMVEIHHYMSVQTHKMCNTKSEQCKLWTLGVAHESV